MGTTSTALTQSPEWRRLTEQAEEFATTDLRSLFERDPDRARRLSVTVDGLHLDYSKNLVTDETLRGLVALAARAGFAERRRAMFAGEHVNVTEDRPALHVALRAQAGTTLLVDGVDVVAEVQRTLDRMRRLADAVREGRRLGGTGRALTTVVNIGIGGSDLGVRVAYEALENRVPSRFPVEFVSNVDPAEIGRVMRTCDPQTTLFVVSSKSFGTPETLANAKAAREWLSRHLPADAVGRHFVGVSNNVAAAREFGIAEEDVFPVPDWVGGRYSYDSAVGLALMIGIGPESFDEMLAGARAMDEHFATAPLGENIPALLGLLGVWYGNFLGYASHAVLPYSSELAALPGHLQQLEMESNGKRVTLAGEPAPTDTVPVIWGQPGTNGQHAFYQMLHQGTRIVPVDFVVIARPNGELTDQQRFLVASAFAQSSALAFGKTTAEVAADGVAPELVPHRTFPGNRPSSTLLFDELDPRSFGQLVTVYEHKVFTQGAVWNINSFDQWGVELGKVLTPRFERDMAKGDGAAEPDHDSSTNALIQRYLSVVD